MNYSGFYKGLGLSWMVEVKENSSMRWENLIESNSKWPIRTELAISSRKFLVLKQSSLQHPTSSARRHTSSHPNQDPRR